MSYKRVANIIGHFNGSDIDLAWMRQRVAVSMESSIELEGWTLIHDKDKVLESLQKLKEQGVFNE